MVCLWALVGSPAAVSAQESGTLSGQVVDTLGARVAGASVTLSRDGSQVTESKSGGEGTFTFSNLSAGRYQVTATAQGFQPRTSDPVYAGPGARATVEVVLEVGPLQQDVVVTAEAGQVLQSQTGAPVTVIDSQLLEAINKPDVLEALRLVPGAQIVQVGERGGATSLFLRGGNSNFTKVLVDGMPANDIGGGFDFSQLDTAGVDRIEVLRQTNSVRYGSDALTGVVNIQTRRGTARVPEFEYAIDGGNLSTFRNSISLGGAVRRCRLLLTVRLLHHRQPHAEQRLSPRYVRGALWCRGRRWHESQRHAALARWKLRQRQRILAVSESPTIRPATAISCTAPSRRIRRSPNRWQSTVRFGSAGQTVHYINPTATGTPFDPFGFGANYLGNTVTLTGADGATVTGRAILDFGGTYPSTFDSRTTRRALSGESTFQVTTELAISGGARWEREQGFEDPDGDPAVTRNNGGAFVEARATVMNRAYLSGGIGVEHNEVFGNDAVPRFSAAVYLRQPSAAALGETKVSFNVGKGIKAPSVGQQQSALFELVQGTPVAPSVSPIGPEKSRGWDIALEQGFGGGQYRARVGYYNNEFENLIEFLSRTALVRAGVPADVAAATAFGAYINSQSFDAQGIELSADAVIRRVVRFGASYTYLDAEVTQAFGASAVTNPAFPNVPIGQYSPLVGERPFRRPANSGTLFVSYADGPAAVALTAYFAGKRDDSTFLSDQFFGNSLLLPNQDLDPAYQKVDLSVSYRVHPQAKVYTSIENLFDKEYEAAYGFPALPFAIRAGVAVTFGGDR